MSVDNKPNRSQSMPTVPDQTDLQSSPIMRPKSSNTVDNGSQDDNNYGSVRGKRSFFDKFGITSTEVDLDEPYSASPSTQTEAQDFHSSSRSLSLPDGQNHGRAMQTPTRTSSKKFSIFDLLGVGSSSGSLPANDAGSGVTLKTSKSFPNLLTSDTNSTYGRLPRYGAQNNSFRFKGHQNHGAFLQEYSTPTSTTVYLWDARKDDDTPTSNNNDTLSSLHAPSHVNVTFEEIHAMSDKNFVKIALSTADKAGGIDYKNKVHFISITNAENVGYSNVLDSINEKHSVLDIVCGSQHFMMLTASGAVFVYGNNVDGQLGLGAPIEKVNAPTLLKFKDVEENGDRIVQLAAGSRHCMALSSQGDVFVWGHSKNGRCGVLPQPEKDTIHIPQKLETEKLKQAIDGVKKTMTGRRSDNNEENKKSIMATRVICGWSHSIIIVEDITVHNANYVFAFGRGTMGQCGTGTTNDVMEPALIHALLSVRITECSAGYYHTVCLSDKGQLYSFGGNSEGQCGQGDTNDVLIPKMISSISAYPIKHVVCGAFNTLAYYPGTMKMFPPPMFGTTQSKLYICGKVGGNKALRPTEIPAMEGKEILHISVTNMSKTVLVARTYDKSSSEQRIMYEVIGLPLSDRFIGSFPCKCDVMESATQHPAIEGQLLVTMQHIVFYARVLDNVTKIVIGFDEILSLERCNSSMVIPNGLQVFTNKGKFRFFDLADREITFGILSELWIESHHTVFGSEPFNTSQTPANEDSLNENLFQSPYDRYPNFPWQENYLSYLQNGDKTRDVYGFPLPEEYRNDYLLYVEHFLKDYQARKTEWEGILNKTGHLETLIKNKSPVLKKLIRKGIPPEYRGEVWFKMTGAESKSRYSYKYYQYLLNLSTTIITQSHSKESVSATPSKQHNTRAIDAIELDIDRTFPEHFFYTSQEGKDKLRRVLIAYAIRNPNIGYCQSMNTLAAVLLLFMTETQAFWTLAAIVEDLQCDYFGKSMIGILVDQTIFDQQLKLKFPMIFNHLKNVNFPISAVTFKWFICMFVGSLPNETAFQAWENFFFEGHRSLFLVAASVFKLNHNIILESDSVEVSFLLKNSTKSLFYFNQLLETAEDINGFYPDNIYDIRIELHIKYKAQIMEDNKRKKEMKLRNKLRHQSLKIQFETLEKTEQFSKYWRFISNQHDKYSKGSQPADAQEPPSGSEPTTPEVSPLKVQKSPSQSEFPGEDNSYEVSELSAKISSLISLVLVDCENAFLKKTIENHQANTPTQDAASLSPLLDQFLQNKVVETICNVAIMNKPNGIRPHVFQSLTNLLREIEFPLLEDPSVYQAVAHLVEYSVKDPTFVQRIEMDYLQDVYNSNTNSEERILVMSEDIYKYIGFLQVLVEEMKQLSEESTLPTSKIVDAFFMESDKNEIEFSIFLALHPFITCHDDIIAERARKTINTLLQCKSDKVTEYLLSIDFCETMVENLVNVFYLMPPSMVKPKPGSQPMQTPSPSLGQSPSTPVGSYLSSSGTSPLSRSPLSTSPLYRARSTSSNTSNLFLESKKSDNQPKNKAKYDFEQHLKYIMRVINTAQKAISHRMLEIVTEYVFKDLIENSLRELESRSSTMLYLTEWLMFTEGPFLHALLVFLFQDVAKPEEPVFEKGGMATKAPQPADSDDEDAASDTSKIPLHYLMYKAVLSPDIEMSVAALRLLFRLVTLQNEVALFVVNKLFINWTPLTVTMKLEDNQTSNANTDAKKNPTPPSSRKKSGNSNDNNFGQYVVLTKLSHFYLNVLPKEVSDHFSSSNINILKELENESYSNVNIWLNLYKKFRTEQSKVLASSEASPATITIFSSTPSSDSPPVAFPGVFLEVLLHKFSTYFHNPIEINIELCNTFTALIHVPVPKIYTYMLMENPLPAATASGGLPPKQQAPNLYHAIVQLAKEIGQQYLSVKSYTTKVNSLKKSLFTRVRSLEQLANENAENNTLCKIILLEDLCKKITAILVLCSKAV